MNKKTEFRTEHDAQGEVQVPVGAYWGAGTLRYKELIQGPGQALNPRLIESIIHVKRAAAIANAETGRLATRLAKAITQAADEVLSGQWRSEFIIDLYCPGAPHALNTNANEVLANRATEILGGQPGTYTLVHPEAHINLSQSANDVFPTAMRLAVLLTFKQLEPVLLDLERLLRRKSLQFDKVLKLGRIHLQDAQPVTLGQEFNAYGSSIERSYRRLLEASQALYELNLGATHLGTGINAAPAYVAKAVEQIGQSTGLKVRSGEDFFRLAQSLADFVEFSSALKELAVELIKIANDLRLLASGPNGGLFEINLPPVISEHRFPLPDLAPVPQEPLLTESLNMCAFDVIGADVSVTMAAQAGQLDLNTMTPLVVQAVLRSLDLLRRGILAFNQQCIAGITANSARCRESLERSASLFSILGLYIGADNARSLMEECEQTGKGLRQAILDRQFMSASEFDRIMHYRLLTQPGLHGDTGSSGGAPG